MSNVGRHATLATLWSATEITARYGVQIAVTVILARLLSPQDFGLIAIVLVFTSIGALLTDAGFGVALVQRRSKDVDDEATAFFITLSIGILAAALLWFTSSVIATFYHMHQLVAVIRWMAVVLPLGAFGCVPDALLTSALNFKARTRAQVISSLFSALIAISLAWTGFGIWSFVWQAITDAGLRSVLLWVFSRWWPRGRFRIQSLKSLFGFGGFMLLSNALSTVSTRMQLLAIGKLFNSRELGYYSLAQSTPQAPASFISSLLNRVGLPLFSSIAHDKVRLRQALRVSLQVSLFVFLPCMIGIALTALPLIKLIYGARWTGASPILMWLALATALWPIHVLNLIALSALGRSDLFFRLEVIKNAITLIATFMTSPHGPTAMAASMFVAALSSAVINTWYSGILLGYGLAAQMSDQLKTLWITLLTAIPAWSILHWVPSTAFATLAAMATYIIAYVGLAVAFNHPALKELRGMLRNVLSSADHALI